MTEHKTTPHHEPLQPQQATAPAPPVPPASAKEPDSPLAIISMVLGVTSFTGPGLLFGIPAIITGMIALKKKQNNSGLSITGIVTGAISTFFSLLFIALIIWALFATPSHPEWNNNPREQQYERSLFDSSST